MDFQTVLNIQVLFVKLMFDEQSVYWFGDIHRLSLSLCQGHSTTQLMQMIEYQKILPAFLTLMLVFFWEWFCDVLFYTLWREHLCTAALFVCLGCDKMKWNAVSLDYNPWVLVFFISFLISSYHVLIIIILRMVKIFVQIAQHDKHDIENLNRNLP